MFAKNLQQPTLANDVANQYFKGFPVEGTFSRDFSFAAVIRALLFHRVPEGEGVKLIHKDCSLREGDIRGVDAKVLFGSMFGSDYLQPNSLTLLNINGRPEDNEKLISILDEKFVSINSEYTEQEILKRFVAENMDARFYTCEATRTTVIAVVRLTMPRYHLLQAIMPRYFPWHFKEKPLDDDEKKLLTGASKKDSSDFEAALEHMAQNRFDMRRITVSALIGDFERQSRKVQLDEAKRSLERVDDQIRENREVHARLISDRDERMIRYQGIKAAINNAGDSSELVAYCMDNKNLTIVSTHDSHIRLIIRGYLNVFDPEVYEVASENEESILYTEYEPSNDDFEEVEERKMLLDAIFGPEAEIQIRTCGFFDLDIRGHVNTSSNYDFPREFNDCLPNPHLHYYSCLGNQERHIRAALERGDIPGAITQCGASTASVNLGEAPTMERFMGELFSTGKKFLELPNGDIVSPSEALKWIKNKD